MQAGPDIKRILVTRPESAAVATVERLRAAGFEPVSLPLSRTVALAVGPDFPDCDMVAVTSANALRHASGELLRHYAGKTCYAVGARTAAAARDAGLRDVREGEGDASLLIALIRAERGEGRTVAYLAGRVRMPDFETALRGDGMTVHALETYDTEQLEATGPQVEALIAGRPIDAVLLYSAKAASAFMNLSCRPELAATFSQTVHCCLSERIAARLHNVDPRLIRVAARPDEDALLALAGEGSLFP